MVLIFLYHSAAEDGVPVIEHGGLTGGYRALRLVKDDVNGVAPDRHHRRPLLGVAVAYLRLAAQLMRRRTAAYPVEVYDICLAAEQLFIAASEESTPPLIAISAFFIGVTSKSYKTHVFDMRQYRAILQSCQGGGDFLR